MIQNVFGMEENRVMKGFNFIDKQKEELMNFISKEIFWCNYNQNLPRLNLDQTFSSN